VSPPVPDYGRFDRVALAVGFGLILLGAAVVGFFETVLGSVHVSQRVVGVGVVVFHTSFDAELRAAVMAVGFLVLFVWGLSRVARAILE
jgi:hypothetical protein